MKEVCPQDLYSQANDKLHRLAHSTGSKQLQKPPLGFYGLFRCAALWRYACQQQNTVLPSVFITPVARQLHRAKVGNVTVNTSPKTFIGVIDKQ